MVPIHKLNVKISIWYILVNKIVKIETSYQIVLGVASAALCYFDFSLIGYCNKYKHKLMLFFGYFRSIETVGGVFIAPNYRCIFSLRIFMLN